MDSIQEGRSLGPLPLRSHDTRRFRLKAVSNEVKVYEKYFHKDIAKEVSYAQLIFCIIVVVLQLITMGLLFGPTEMTADISTKTIGIWPSIITSVAAGVTLWATRKLTYCKLHTSMAFHIIGFLAHFYMGKVIIEGTIPSIQTRIYEIGQTTGDENNKNRYLSLYATTTTKQVEAIETELDRMTACLVFNVTIALAGIFQLLMAAFMAFKTGLSICVGRTQLEGRCLQVEAVNRGVAVGIDAREERQERVHEKGSEEESVPKLERSDTLPPPPYESGYFHPSLNV